jgi:hypothetical protein
MSNSDSKIFKNQYRSEYVVAGEKVSMVSPTPKAKDVKKTANGSTEYGTTGNNSFISDSKEAGAGRGFARPPMSRKWTE